MTSVSARSTIDIISIVGREAAKATGLPLRTLQDWTKRGKVPAARRKGKRYVYVVAELRDWIINAPAVEAH